MSGHGGAGRPARRGQAIDAIRGLSFLVVFFAHAAAAGFAWPWLDFGGAGKAGVWLFFCLSAVMIFRRLRSLQALALSPARRCAAFLSGRLLRLLGPYFVLLLALWVAGVQATDIFIRHVMLIEGRGVFWSISTEAQFYLIAPLLFMFASSRVGWLAIAASCLGVALGNLLVPFDSPWLVLSERLLLTWHYLPFVGGALLAAARLVGADTNRQSSVTAMPLFLLAVVCYVLVALGLESAYWQATQQATRGAALISLVLSTVWLTHRAVRWDEEAVTNGTRHAPLPVRLLAPVGRLSYSLYLTHMIGMLLVTQHLHLTGWAGLVLAIGLTAALGGGFFLVVERPLERLSQRVASGIAHQRKLPPIIDCQVGRAV